MNYELGIRIFT